MTSSESSALKVPASHTLQARLKGLMFFRVCLVTLFMTGAILINAETLSKVSETKNLLTLSLIIVTYALTIIYAMMWRKVTLLHLLAKIQIILDTIISATLILITGGLHTSIFLFTLFLPIISSAIILHKHAALYTATFVSAFIIYLTLAEFNFVPSPFFDVSSAPNWRRLLFEGGINILFAFLLAWVSGQLSGQLGDAKEEIARQEGDLHKLQALNEDILESLNSGLLTIDGARNIIFFNRAAQEITGLHPKEVINQPLSKLFPDIEHVLSIHHPMKLDVVQKEHRFENLYTTPSGKVIHLGFSTSPLRYGKDTNGGLIVIFQDLTGIKMLESQAKRSERLAAIGQLSAASAHEIRNPLASISGSVEMLQHMVSVVDEEELLMNIILREVDRLNSLITDFLEYSKPRAITVEPTDAPTLLQEILQLFKNRSDQVHVVHLIDTQLEGLLVALDQDAFRQIVWNLLNNATEAMVEEVELSPSISTIKQVEHRTYKDDAHDASQHKDALEELLKLDFHNIIYVTMELEIVAHKKFLKLSIQDNGPGIPEELKERIFEPFFTTKPTGTGLGLATIFRLVEEHQGVLTFAPNVRLEGAHFVIKFPISHDS